MVAPKKSRKTQVPGETTEAAKADVMVADAEHVEVDGGLPDAASIDASKLTERVLTKQGWLLPNGGADANV